MRLLIAIYLVFALMVIATMYGCAPVRPEVKVVEVKKEYPLCTILEPQPVQTVPRPNMQNDDEEFIEYLMDLVNEYAERSSYRLEHNNACVRSIRSVHE
jgi:hypothetical protein